MVPYDEVKREVNINVNLHAALPYGTTNLVFMMSS